MTSDRDPPRLRTLGGELPAELVLAVRDSEGDTATPADVATVARRVRAATSDHDSAISRTPLVPRRPAVRGRAASLVLMFTYGAVAGVVVSGGVFVVDRVRGSEPTRSAPPSVTPQPRPGLRPATPPPAQNTAPETLSDAELPPLPRPSRESARLPSQNSAVELPTTAPSASPSANREELALVARAQGALGSHPAQALVLTSDHARKFPHGALVQEREVVAIDALLRLGRPAEAAARAARFHREFPASVHGRRLDVLLGTGGGAARDHN